MRDVLFGSNRLLDDRTLTGAEVKREFHDLEWQKEIGEDDRCIHPQCFRSADGYFGRQRGILADLQQRMLLADSAVFSHVASCLTHEPHRRTLYRHSFAGSHEDGIRRGHELLNVAFFVRQYARYRVLRNRLCDTESDGKAWPSKWIGHTTENSLVRQGLEFRAHESRLPSVRSACLRRGCRRNCARDQRRSRSAETGDSAYFL